MVAVVGLGFDEKLAALAADETGAHHERPLDRNRRDIAYGQLTCKRRLLQHADHEAGDIVERGGDDAAVGAAGRAFERATEHDARDDFVGLELHVDVHAPGVVGTADRTVGEPRAVVTRREAVLAGGCAHQREPVAVRRRIECRDLYSRGVGEREELLVIGVVRGECVVQVPQGGCGNRSSRMSGHGRAAYAPDGVWYADPSEGQVEGGAMSKVRKYASLLLAIVLVAAASVVVTANVADVRRPLRILVTNDDGVGAAGIAAVVDALQGLRNVEVRVVAPATNQSGTGGNVSTTPLHVTPATTASGDQATAVAGFPADTVLYDVLAAHDTPDVVVSGINAGQNLGNITEISGTVGAARQANRLGIPAIAVSQGLAPSFDYSTAARLTTLVLEAFRHRYEKGTALAQTINLNVPSCPTGMVRGVRLLPLGQTSRVTGYAVQSGSIDNGTFAPAVFNQNPIATSDCASHLTWVLNDIEAFNNGFATATVLNPDFTDPSVFERRTLRRWEGIDRDFLAP